MTRTPRLVFMTILATLAYLGLAILGWGGFTAFFSHQALIALTISVFVLSGVALFSSGNLSPGEREDRAKSLSARSLLRDRALTQTGRDSGRSTEMPFAGSASFSSRPGGALRIWPVFVLGHRFSGLVAIQPGHRLVTNGIYGVIRHPSYLGLLIGSLGWALAFRSGVGVLLTALLIPPLVARIHSEERLLRTHFGGEYEAYCRRTSRLIPGLY
jgi:hypothetical protein